MKRASAALMLAALALPSMAAADEPPPLGLDLGDAGHAELTLAAQLRGTVRGAADGEPTGDLALVRLRPGLRATLAGDRLTLALALNTSPVALELIEAWAEVRLDDPGLRVRVGQWKVPFTRARAMSFTELVLVDWARVVTEPFGAEHAIGVSASGMLERVGLRWDLGLFAGPPTRAAHGIGLAPTYGERVANLSELGGGRWVERVHPELVGRVTQRLARDRAGDGVELTLSAAADLDPEPRRDLTLRLAPELIARAGIVSASAVLYGGFAELGDRAFASALFGVLAELSIRPLPSLAIALRFARTARTAELLADARAYAEQVITSGQASERQSLRARYARVGRVHAEQELAIGARWDVWGRALALQADAAWLLEEGEGGAVHGWRFRLQTQLAL